jgi:hypothetical protein
LSVCDEEIELAGGILAVHKDRLQLWETEKLIAFWLSSWLTFASKRCPHVKTEREMSQVSYL